MMLFVPPLGGRSNFVFSPKSRRRALGSLLCNNSQSIVMLVEELLECISVRSKPMQLNGPWASPHVVCIGMFDSDGYIEWPLLW